MFYCNPCAEKRDWPKTMFRSKGPCECCGEVAICSEMPSSMLPADPDTAELLEEIKKHL